MGFRRGWLLGLLAGIVAAVISGRPAKPSGPSQDAGAGGSLLDEARAAASAERAATEARLEERFRAARQTGRMPEDPS